MTKAQEAARKAVDDATQALIGQKTAYQQLIEAQDAELQKNRDAAQVINDAKKAADDKAKADAAMAQSADTATSSLNNEASAARAADAQLSPYPAAAK